MYVSSGGMYIPGDRFPMKESTPSKGADSNEQRVCPPLPLLDSIALPSVDH